MSRLPTPAEYWGMRPKQWYPSDLMDLIAKAQRDALEAAARHIESVGEAAGQLQDRGAEHPEVEAIKAVAYAGARGIRALAPEPQEKP